LTTALLQWRLMGMERSAAAANKSKPENKKKSISKATKRYASACTVSCQSHPHFLIPPHFLIQHSSSCNIISLHIHPVRLLHLIKSFKLFHLRFLQ
jgi:hypothetical protein